MRLPFLTFSILLLSFVFADNSTTSQSLPTVQEIEHLHTYSEMEMELQYLNTCSKMLYFDVLKMSMDMNVDTELGTVPGTSWEDVKRIIDLENELDTAKKERNQ